MAKPLSPLKLGEPLPAIVVIICPLPPRVITIKIITREVVFLG
jgi:hypothetical protein